jgi:hypothetical protein
MEDLITLWSKKVLDNNSISDEFKIKFFQELFGEELNDEKSVEYAFKKWRGGTMPSSNVRAIMYNDETKDMFIQFQDKSIYTYYNVDFNLFLKVSNGEATCITSGESKYGSWYVGKNPSLGAATHKYLIKTGVKYKKGGSLK